MKILFKTKHFLAQFLITAALIILAYKPLCWLFNTWQDAAYNSAGLWAFIATFGLFLWSLNSPLLYRHQHKTRLAVMLLMSTALVRLLGQIWAINTLGALALVIDIYALALLLGLNQRKNGLSLLWLAALFAFALPIERIIQRLVGYGLQELSSGAACFLLTSSLDNVLCQGTKIAVSGQQFLIDLPCSGTNSLVVLALTMTLGMVIAKPNFKQSLWAVCLILICAFASNILRIILLVTGALSELLQAWSIDVMLQPWHDLVGLLALFPFLTFILYFCFNVYQQPHLKLQINHRRRSYCFIYKKTGIFHPNAGYFQLIIASCFFISALITVNLKRQPIDIQPTQPLFNLPLMIANQYAFSVPLLAKEQAYFTQYGGAARKAIYGDRQLLITKTTSPLRHLHAPDECLRGLGFKVQYLGTLEQPLMTAVYKVTTPEQQTWRVSVSFINHQGQTATNVSQAIWQWLQNPEQVWYSVQRISPWHYSFEQNIQWDKALFNALDLGVNHDKKQSFIL